VRSSPLTLFSVAPFAPFAPFVAALAGCTSAPFVSAGREGGVDAGPEDARADAAGGACNTLMNTAPLVSEEEVAMAAPKPMGGTVSDGTYFLTTATLFTGPQGGTGPTGTQYQWVTKTSGDAYEVSLSITGRGASDSVTSGTSVASGSTVSFTQTCPVAKNATSTYGFDADGTSVTLYGTQLGTVTGYVFAKQ
jgi:hypothetical protein